METTFWVDQPLGQVMYVLFDNYICYVEKSRNAYIKKLAQFITVLYTGIHHGMNEFLLANITVLI